jgi:hypothetical protein
MNLLDDVPDGLCPLARQHFASLSAGGPLPPGPGTLHVGEAGRPAAGTHVRFTLRVVEGHIAAARFQALGCPHTLAVANWLATELVGRDYGKPWESTPHRWAERFEVPVRKLGRLLIVEDALQAALRAS